MRGLLVLPLFLLFMVWDLSSNHGALTRLVAGTVEHAFRAMGIT